MDSSDPMFETVMGAYGYMSTSNGNGGHAQMHDQYLTGRIEHLESRQDGIIGELLQAKQFARTAANSALATRQSLETLRSDMAEMHARQTLEIVRLISSDTAHEERMKATDARVEQATKVAIAAIIASGKETRSEVTKAVTIPVGAVAAAVTIINWLIQQF